MALGLALWKDVSFGFLLTILSIFIGVGIKRIRNVRVFNTLRKRPDLFFYLLLDYIFRANALFLNASS